MWPTKSTSVKWWRKLTTSCYLVSTDPSEGWGGGKNTKTYSWTNCYPFSVYEINSFKEWATLQAWITAYDMFNKWTRYWNRNIFSFQLLMYILCYLISQKSLSCFLSPSLESFSVLAILRGKWTSRDPSTACCVAVAGAPWNLLGQQHRCPPEQ